MPRGLAPVLLIAAAAVGAVLLVVRAGGGSSETQAEPEADRSEVPAAAPQARPAAGATLTTLPAAEPPTEGLDPSTGSRAQADVRFVVADGAPAARVRASYGPVDSEDAPLQGSADDQGRLRLHADVVGRRVLLDVAAGPRWGAERFDLWAVGSTPVVLSPGCQVWLVLAPVDMDLVGRECAFRIDDVEHRTEVRGLRTLLGTFRGSVCRIDEVGGVPAARMTPAVLPPTGSVEVAWTGEVRARVRFQAPSGAAEVPQVHLSSEGRHLFPQAPTAQGPDWVEFLVPTGSRYVYMASCAGHWALGRLDPMPAETPLLLPPKWERGCRLEALLPEPGPVLWARAYVVSEPGKEVFEADVLATEDHTRILQDPQSSWIDLGAERAGPSHRQWPVEPDVSRSRIVWRCVPRGRVLRLLVAGTRHGTLSQDVTVPRGSENLLVSLHRTTSFTIELRGARTSQPGAEEWLTVFAGGEHTCECTVLLPRGQDRVVVRGFPLGEVASLSVQGGGVRGDARAQVTGEIVVPLPLRALPTAVYRLRVVDPAGAPLPGVGVRFSSGEWGHPEVRTDASGTAAVERGTDAPVRAEVDDVRFASPSMEVPPGGLAAVEAVPRHVVRVEFDLGAREIGLQVGDFHHRVRVVPGSVLVRSVTGKDPIGVWIKDEAETMLFERMVDLTGPSPTSVRVSR